MGGCRGAISGNRPDSSEADIRLTRERIRASDLVKIQICDHVIVGQGKFTSLRELGIFLGELQIQYQRLFN